MQPDTLIQSFANPQSLNRFSYGLNNPINNNDPSGHLSCQGSSWDDSPSCFKKPIDEMLKGYGVTTSGMDLLHKGAVLDAVHAVGYKLSTINGGSAESAFRNVYKKGVAINWNPGCKLCRGADAVIDGTHKLCGTDYSSPGCKPGGGVTVDNQITFASMSGDGTTHTERMIKNVVHELGHAFDNALGNPSGANNGQDIGPFLDRKVLIDDPYCCDWQQHPKSMPNGKSPIETFGDMFIAWTYNAWNPDSDKVDSARNWMNGLAKP